MNTRRNGITAQFLIFSQGNLPAQIAKFFQILKKKKSNHIKTLPRVEKVKYFQLIL